METTENFSANKFKNFKLFMAGGNETSICHLNRNSTLWKWCSINEMVNINEFERME